MLSKTVFPVKPHRHDFITMFFLLSKISSRFFWWQTELVLAWLTQKISSSSRCWVDLKMLLLWISTSKNSCCSGVTPLWIEFRWFMSTNLHPCYTLKTLSQLGLTHQVRRRSARIDLILGETLKVYHLMLRTRCLSVCLSVALLQMCIASKRCTLGLWYASKLNTNVGQDFDWYHCRLPTPTLTP